MSSPLLDFTVFDVMTVVVLVTVCSDAAIACGTTATEFAINATVSLLTTFGSAGASFDAFAAFRLARVDVRCVAAGAGDSSVIVLRDKKMTQFMN